MECEVNKEEQIHIRGADNLYKNKLGTRHAAKSEKSIFIVQNSSRIT